MTIDVAQLRRFAEEAGWPSVTPTEFVELLDAYDERDRLRAEREIPEGMEAVIEWARRHPEYMWQENQRNENEVTRLEAERDRLRVMLERLRNRMAEPDQPIIQWDAGTWIPRIDAALEGRE